MVQSTYRPEIRLIIPNGNVKGLSSLKRITRWIGCHAAVGMPYPHFESYLPCLLIRNILNDSAQFDFFTVHIGIKSAFTVTAQKPAAAIWSVSIVRACFKVRKIRWTWVGSGVFLNLRRGNVELCILDKLRHSLVALQAANLAKLIICISHYTLVAWDKHFWAVSIAAGIGVSEA